MEIFYKSILTTTSGELVFQCNISESDAKAISKGNSFLEHILLPWISINTNEHSIDISKQFIWNNTDIKLNNKTIYYKDWHEKRITK